MKFQAAQDYLLKRDRRLGRLMQEAGPCGLKQGRGTPYQALIEAVAHQQLHGKAAATILGRFRALYKDGAFPEPAHLLETPAEKLRAVGFSASKVAALHDIARKTEEGLVPSRATCQRLSDDEIIARLTEVRGVGRWTVEMLLIFTLNRPDVLPVDDFGIREGYRLVWGLEEQPKPKELRILGERWAPYRTLASWYLWRGLEIYRKRV